MNITIKAKNTTLTPAIKNFIADKLSSLAKFLKEEDRIRVELEVDKKNKDGKLFRAEIDIQPRGYFADSRGNDFYEALDLTMPKIKEQLAKHKDKVITKRKKASRNLK